MLALKESLLIESAIGHCLATVYSLKREPDIFQISIYEGESLRTRPVATCVLLAVLVVLINWRKNESEERRRTAVEATFAFLFPTSIHEYPELFEQIVKEVFFQSEDHFIDIIRAERSGDRWYQVNMEALEARMTVCGRENVLNNEFGSEVEAIFSDLIANPAKFSYYANTRCIHFGSE